MGVSPTEKTGTKRDLTRAMVKRLNVPRSEVMKSEQYRSTESSRKGLRGEKTYDNQTEEIQ